MRLPNGEVLMHARAPYDPKKAHEYYLRTRKLKGRKKGAAKVVADTVSGGTKPGAKKHTQIEQLTPQQKREQRAYAEARVASIKKKLTELNKALKKKMAEAKKAEADAKKPPSAADKAKAARESKKYRQKHKQSISAKAKAAADKKKSGSKEPSSDSVAGLKKQIAAAQTSLKAAIAKQRALS